MFDKCPGQSSSKVRAEELFCNNCGKAVEIFTDEVKAKCSGCSNYVFRDKLPSCIDWCKAAEECVGREKLKQLKRR